MTDFLKIAKSIVVHFAHICAYGVETVTGYSHNRVNITIFMWGRGSHRVIANTCHPVNFQDFPTLLFLLQFELYIFIVST